MSGPSKSKLLAAIFLAPLTGVVPYALILLASNLHSGFMPLQQASLANILGAIVGIACVIEVFSLVMMLLFALPAYFVLRRLQWASIWAAMVVGFLAAALFPIVLQLEGYWEGSPVAAANVRTLLNQPWSLLWDPINLVGIWIGATFWWIANGKIRPTRATDADSRSRHG